MTEFDEDIIRAVVYKSFIFKNLSVEVIENILSSSVYRVVFYNKGELVIQEDEYINYIGLVLDGELNLCKYSSQGSEILLGKLENHEVLNLDIICTPSKKSFYSAYAIKPTFLLVIDYYSIYKADFFSEKDKINILQNVIQYLGNESAKQCHKVEIISQKNIRDKIMTYLLIQKNNKKSSKFKISFDRDQLANYLCINRSVLSHELSMMQKEGLIKFQKNEFEILR